MASSKKDSVPFHEEFANKIIKMLEEGTAPWQTPWHPAENLAPRNPLSGTVYKGVNRLHLSMSGHEDPRWMTLKQANDAGYRIKAGSHSTACADNDHAMKRDGKPYNAGVEKAQIAAQKANAKVKVPAFTDTEKAQGLTDFNDLHKAQGLEAVQRQVGKERAQTRNRELQQ